MKLNKRAFGVETGREAVLEPATTPLRRWSERAGGAATGAVSLLLIRNSYLSRLSLQPP